MNGLVCWGETVEVIRFEADGSDELGNPIKKEMREAVAGVLVAVGAQSEPGGSTRPDGERVAFTLYFPRGYAGELDGCKVAVRGHICRVKGHPGRYPPVPGNPWNMACEVEHDEG